MDTWTWTHVNVNAALLIVSGSEWVSRVLRPAQHIIGHFRDESFQAITSTGTDNSEQMGENKPKSQIKQSLVASAPVRTAHMCVLKTV